MCHRMKRLPCSQTHLVHEVPPGRSDSQAGMLSSIYWKDSDKPWQAVPQKPASPPVHSQALPASTCARGKKWQSRAGKVAIRFEDQWIGDDSGSLVAALARPPKNFSRIASKAGTRTAATIEPRSVQQIHLYVLYH